MLPKTTVPFGDVYTTISLPAYVLKIISLTQPWAVMNKGIGNILIVSCDYQFSQFWSTCPGTEWQGHTT